MMIVIKRVSPAAYEARLEDGEVVVYVAKEPLLAAARVLKARGVADETELLMRHHDNEMVCLRTTVGKAAALTVIENDGEGPRFARYKPFPADLAR